MKTNIITKRFLTFTNREVSNQDIYLSYDSMPFLQESCTQKNFNFYYASKALIKSPLEFVRSSSHGIYPVSDTFTSLLINPSESDLKLTFNKSSEVYVLYGDVDIEVAKDGLFKATGSNIYFLLIRAMGDCFIPIKPEVHRQTRVINYIF